MLLYLWSVFLSVVSWINVIQFQESPSSIYITYNISKLVQLELYQIQVDTCTSVIPVLKKLHWIPTEHQSVFKTATLVYKFLYTGFHEYFAPYLSSSSSSYSTRCIQSVGDFLWKVPPFYSKVCQIVCL